MNKNTNTKLQEFKDAVIKKAENLVRETCPETIVKLNELLETPAFKKLNFDEIYEELNIPLPKPVKNDSNNGDESSRESIINPPANEIITDEKVIKEFNSRVTCNRSVCEIIDTMKPIVRELLEDCNLMKMWISYMIPKIEDGNNFGVSVQESTLSEIEMTEQGAASVFNDFSGYFTGRAKLISKVVKYPNIDDYRRSIAEYDEKQYLHLCHILREVRNRYSALHDIVIKNMDKLKKPRSLNFESLY